MAQFIVVARVENGFQAARRMARLILWLLELPTPGVHIGGGRHVTIPASVPDPPPTNGAYKGWTTRWRPFHKHPLNNGSDTDRWAILITPELTAAWLAKRDQLTALQRAWVQDHITSAADLAADWFTGGALTDEDVLPEPTP